MSEQAIHPGQHVRLNVLPGGITVKDAAKQLGVGRPALSNLLNGKASLSPDMALRLEKAFGANRDDLLRRQSEYDEFQRQGRNNGIAVVVRPYARGAFEIRALDIEGWSTQIDARSRLPALLRKLVHTTGADLTKVDFPAYDNAQRHGWDGQIETLTGTPWIPAGKSGWEFGCNADFQKKAEDDYESRTASTSAAERSETTFVFVTPKNWPGKEAWRKKKIEAGDWKSVQVLDASDLEQWLEQSLAAQCWMAEQLGISTEGLLSLDAYWNLWASATEPSLNKELFQNSVETHRMKLEDWLKQPPSGPLVVSGSSAEEALACLVCLFEKVESALAPNYDRALVFRSISAFHAATKSLQNFIAIIASSEVEKALAGFQKRQHTVIVHNQNAVDGRADIVFDLPSSTAFKASLERMGFDEDTAERHARACGHSPTVLRRQLSRLPAIRMPPWARDKGNVRKVIPMTFSGAWNSELKADQEIIAHLADMPYAEFERCIADVLQLEQSPVWSIDRFRGLVSKLDTLYAVHASVTGGDLERFFDAASYVLCEDDPALDLPEDKRWCAHIYGKTRDHSSVIRRGLCETLALLSVHGNSLFQARLGLNVEARVNEVVRDLLKPLDPKTWLSQQYDLPMYAEAAPEEFLKILEEDLRSGDPKVNALLKPVDKDAFFGDCPRTGLLWALELLAWKPERLTRVASILATLAEKHIDDNWSNRPDNSLKSIFRSWMPQTAASVEERNRSLAALARRHPHVGWMLCVDQFTPGSTVGHYNYRPEWRNDASGVGQPVDGKQRYEAQRKALDLALAWPSHSEETLADLVMRLQAMPKKDQETVWNMIVSWRDQGAGEREKAALREKVRQFALTRHARRGRKVSDATRARAREVYDLLQPADLLERHKWLFAQTWVQESADELEDEKFDHRKRDERIAKLRREALQEILSRKGREGILDLCATGNAAGTIGWLLADGVLPKEVVPSFVVEMISGKVSAEVDVKRSQCAAGLLGRLDADDRRAMLAELIKDLLAESSEDEVIRLCACAPFHATTWAHVDELPPSLRDRYWREVSPHWGKHSAAELNSLVHELLRVDRPRAAYATVQHDLSDIESGTLIKLLRKLGSCDSEQTDGYRLAAHDISGIFESLQERGGVSREQLAQLELSFIGTLEHTEYGVPNLERQFAQSPQLFVHALVLAYKRSDDKQDPPEFQVPEGRRKAAWRAAYTLLREARRTPGTQEDGTIDRKTLTAWVAEARQMSEKYARKAIGDSVIGRILAACPAGEDGIWPCDPVRQCLEEIASKEMSSGMAVAKYNARGVTSRRPGDGGEQEHVLAARYRNWSKQLAFEYPFVSSILEEIASMFDRDGEDHDTDRRIRRRIRG